jgi:hypothetical protein
MTTQYKIKALWAAVENARKEVSSIRNTPVKPWSGDTFVDEIAAAEEAVRALEDEVIALEHSLRDPEQDAEMRAEINAAIALTGNYDDDASLYMHTPMEEERFQRSIHEQVRRSMDEEHGYYDSYGPCPTCKNMTDYEDCVQVGGETCCSHCVDDAVAFLHFLSRVTNTPFVMQGRWEDEYAFVREDDRAA